MVYILCFLPSPNCPVPFDEQKEDQQQNDEQQDEKENKQEQQQQPSRMSEENAQQILDALMQDEKNTLEKARKNPVRSRKSAEKDW